MLTDPKDVAAEVAAIIRLQPARHDQSLWFDGHDGEDGNEVIAVETVLAALYSDDDLCGSTACVAGWAAILAAAADTYIAEGSYLLPSYQPIESAGRRALGISHDEAMWLFNCRRSREQVLAALDSLAKGEEITVPED